MLAFEALARLRSVSAAADELSVTPSAVSHRMRQLETQLGPFDQHFERADEVARVRLIRSPRVPWTVWFQACDIALPEPREGAQFNDVGLMLDAAAAGFGVTLTRLKLAADWLDSGRLVRLSSRSVASPFHHFLCWKPGTLARWECATFVDWLAGALSEREGCAANPQIPR